MVNLRSGAVVGIGVVVLGFAGWFSQAPGAPAQTNESAFQSVPAVTPDLSVPDSIVSDASVAARTPRTEPAIHIPDAAHTISTLTPVRDTVPAASSVEPAAPIRPAAADAESLPEPIELAQNFDGILKQDCDVQFSTNPPQQPGIDFVIIEASRRLSVTDASGAIGVALRTWTILGEDGQPLAGGDNASFQWENGSTVNPRPLSAGFGPTISIRLDQAGSYTLRLEISTTSGSCVGNLPIVVEECVAPPGATLAMDNSITVNHGSLLPLQDWAPLGYINMRGDVDEDAGLAAQRILGPFTYTISQGPLFFDDINYDNDHGPRRTDILEFGLVYDSGPEGPDGILDFTYDTGPILTWANDGFPYGTVTEQFGSLIYNLDFYANGLEQTGYIPSPSSANGVSPFNWPISSTSDSGNQYILVFRTSATWRNGTTLTYSLIGPFMVDLVTPRDPFNPASYFINVGCGDDAEPVDTYPDPNFFAPEDTQYSASFAAFDATGATGGGQNPVDEYNRFGWTAKYYTPLGEHIRPRFDAVNQAFDMVLGEWMELRALYSLEQWYSLIGLNMHDYSEGGLREVNLILTDIGGDPDNPIQGNGGFDPRQGLEDMTFTGGTIGNNLDTAINNDYSYNGVWVFYDTNNNGVFDPPTHNEGGGVTFTDHPMVPSRFLDAARPNLIDPFEPGWSYIANPAWGGDPAWKMRMRFNGARRSNPGATPAGTFEPVPDALDGDTDIIDSHYSEDYFVVMRADSGFQDISLRPGDGTGLDPAADFRAFIEPRNFNPQLTWFEPNGTQHNGGWDGGIFATSQRGSGGRVLEPNVIEDPWQADPLWNWPFPDEVHYHSQLGLTQNQLRAIADGVNPEPWWPQRTHNWNNTKIQKGMVEIHDLVLTYETNNEFAKVRDVNYQAGAEIAFGLGFVKTTFDDWIDPFNDIIDTFFDRHSVGVSHDTPDGTFSVSPEVAVIQEDDFNPYQFSFETIPFFDSIFDVPPFGPRSPFYTPPFQQPTLPDFSTWPPAQSPANKLPAGEYPQLSDWPQAQRRARLLKQHTDVLSDPVALLGFNFTGADDPITNRIAQTRLEEITVAFWGPDFTPSDLLPLDRAGESEDSGVLLYQDAGGGVFDPLFSGDFPLPLNNLAWRNVPEPVDIDGDGVADDINGDGTVDAADNCWVLRLRPRSAWTVPTVDIGANTGDDLFLVVRTSQSIRRFENFRAFVPSTLPSRTLSERVAGVKLAPNQAIPAAGIVKSSPEENAVQDWYGHDMLESNVPAAVVDLTTDGATISPIDEEPTPVLGIDVSTNRPAAEAQPYTSETVGEGTRGNGTMTVPGNPFTAGELIGDFVIDSNYEPFQITANTANTITLLSGTPAPGPWIIAREPTFLEQIIVEFYDEGNDGGFNLNEDLLLLNAEDPNADPPILSGVAIYRDNDFHPDNTDGVFDPDIDIALKLDDPPVRIGVQGEPQQQVKFVFSSPGTDNLPVPIAQQPRLRQWVPDSWNEKGTAEQPAPGESPDFFVVIRASSRMQVGDDFRVGLVSWGPNTPTEPDPDNFTNPPPPVQPQDEFDIFSEFPWGARALGFITFYKEQPFYHFWERTRDQNETSQFIRAAQQQDISGFNWVRSSANKAVQTGVITASTDGANIVITSVNPTELPRVVPEGGLVMRIDGRGFGGSPIVTIEGIQVLPDAASDNSITITIPAGTAFDLPVTLTVENSETGEIATWTQFTIEGGGGLFITNVTPFQLPRFIPDGGIVLTIAGFGFGDNPNVTLGNRTLQVQNASDQLITALIPGGLDLSTIELVLTVTNPTTNESDTFEDFEIVAIQLLTASPNVIPPFPPPSGINVRLGGSGFGTNPIVTFNGFNQNVIEASDTEILVGVANIGFVVPGEFITVSVTNPDINETATRDDLIRVGNLPAEDAPTASLEITDGIEAAGKDGHALVPLNDWVPLFHISMTHGEDEFAPRVLSKLRYVITADNADERDWGRVAGPELSDILDFALFENFGAEDDEIGSLDRLDAAFDSILVGNDGTPAVWNNEGKPLGRLIQAQRGFLVYEIDFIGTGTPANPQFPVISRPEPNSYIVAVRTSATWRSMTSLGYDVISAEMVDPDGNFPIGDDGTPSDEYTPDFFGEGETLDPSTGYSASFAVWDISGGLASPDNMSYFNQWTWPNHLYTPSAEHSRPRWDRAGTFVDFLSGEWLDLRNVFSLESWVAAVGINLHATNSIHEPDPLRSAFHLREDANPPEPLYDVAYLEEINLVITDIGADPTAPPGDGGFDPRTMLDPIVADVTGNQDNDDEFAIGSDISFNGLWIWYDGNNNGVFDPPTVVPFNQGGGITYNGDYPMLPLFFDDGLNFEYVPFPPTGGDPWWKIKIQLDGVRRQIFSANEDPNVDGAVEPVPDQLSPFADLETASEYSHDYFVVYRADSGAQDASMRSGDGTAMRPGADFRIFVEPRRFNPVSGSTTGGIYVDSMIPGLGFSFLGGNVWQDDVRWGADEPWWNQRTSNHNSAMPHRAMIDVHDLVLTYSSSSAHRITTDIDLFGADFGASGVCFGYADQGNLGTTFDLWMDPFGLLQAQFLNRHSAFVWDDGFVQFTVPVFVTDDGDTIELGFVTDDEPLGRQFAYETTPFYIDAIDGPPAGPRVPTYPNPPLAPSLPTYGTWPAHSEANVYPRASDWDIADRRARLLKQHVDAAGDTTAMLGINLAGVDDPIANRITEPKLASITVALWGPDLSPDDFKALDPTGTDPTSGVLLWEDTNQSGVFEGRLFDSFFTAPATQDAVVPLADLAWPAKAELIDLDGDGVADDMDGNGLVDDRDRAWVLRLQPAALWSIPRHDQSNFSYTITYIGCGVFFIKDNRESTEIPFAPKALDNEADNTGDDLFITVRTSETISRFEQFRMVIPATLPERSAGQRVAGIQMSPVLNVSPGAYEKLHPEEGPVQEFYGHDMLEANVPLQILDLTQANQTINNNGGVVPVLGLDISTNRENATLAEGPNGTGGVRAFTVANATWAPGAFVGHYLIDSNYESFEITGNTANRLDLLSGAPANGRWRIVKDPTFLEQLIVEIYNESEDGQDTDFNIAVDLLPIVQDMTVSGIAIYRDNDSHPNNTNGQFDPGIDIPIRLDGPPQAISSATGPENQFLFVFSSPGTDNVPQPKDQQNRFRQWVPDTYGHNSSSEFAGADFFVVVRASNNIDVGDDFRVGIVGWGPNTPTFPDPDTFLPGNNANVMKEFDEFPWGSRAVGFVTVFSEPQTNYFLEGFKARQEPDASGFDFIRSGTAKKRRTFPLVGRKPPIGPNTIKIDSVSENKLPQAILPGQTFDLVIYGDNFGTTPQVSIGGYDVTVTQATDETINVSLRSVPGVVPQEPVVLIVSNPATKETSTRTDLFILIGSSADAPRVTSVSPNRGGSNVFPVTVKGSNFNPAPYVEVLFGTVKMDIVSATPTAITVSFPRGGFPSTGPLDVTVRNLYTNFSTAGQHILVNGFTYQNGPSRGFGCSGGPVGGSPKGDALVLGAALLLCLALWRKKALVP